MALERRNPLPVGTYWQDFFGENRAAFRDWYSVNKLTVKVRATESFEEPEPGRDWIKFETLAPTAWDAKRFGFPTIIKPGEAVNASSDTVQRPDPEKDPIDKLGDELSSAGSATSRLVQMIALLGGALVLSNLWSRSRGR
jgi:hypothetical protein